MFDSKFYATMASLVIAVLVICNYNPKSKEEINEGFLPQFGTKVQTNLYTSTMKPGKDTHTDYVTLQSTPPPRFQNLDKNALLRFHNTQMGCHHQAVCGANSLNSVSHEKFTDMAMDNFDETKEGFTKNGCKCGPESNEYMSEPIMKSDYAHGNYHEVSSEDSVPAHTDTLPMGDMTMSGLDELGQETQFVQMDRLIYANRNSRLRSQGDPIRGDLPIVPCDVPWFKPSVHPNLDLQEGALSVMGGHDNSTQQRLAELINKGTKGTDVTISGINVSNQQEVQNTDQFATLNVTSFP